MRALQYNDRSLVSGCYIITVFDIVGLPRESIVQISVVPRSSPNQSTLRSARVGKARHEFILISWKTIFVTSATQLRDRTFQHCNLALPQPVTTLLAPAVETFLLEPSQYRPTCCLGCQPRETGNDNRILWI